MKKIFDEQKLKKEFDEIMREADRLIKAATPISRIFAVIAMHIGTKNDDGELTGTFQEWLMDGRNIIEKEIAMLYLFDTQFAGDDDPLKSKPGNRCLSDLLKEGEAIPVGKYMEEIERYGTFLDDIDTTHFADPRRIARVRIPILVH